MFDSAEGKTRIAGDHGVEEDASAFELGGEAVLLGSTGPGAGAEAEGRVVGEAMASSSEATRKSNATGPKISSRQMAAFRGTFAMTVGLK